MLRLALVTIVAAVALSLAMAHVVAPSPPAAPQSTLIAPPLAASAPALTGVGQELTLARDGSGRFQVDVAVNGQTLPFLVDTGADQVALTVEAARRAGLYVDPTAFEPVAISASGTVRGQRVKLDRIDIGGRRLEGVDALVLEGLGTNLLGQSVLGRLGGVEMRGDSMVLR